MTQDTITITYAQLKAKRACADQLALFEERFGDAVTFTRDDVGDKAQGFNVSWLAKALLSAPLWAKYDRKDAALLAEYELQRVPLWAEYGRQREALLAEYERKEAALRVAEYERKDAALRAETERKHAPLWAEYERQRAPLWAEYDRQRALVFFDLYLRQETGQ